MNEEESFGGMVGGACLLAAILIVTVVALVDRLCAFGIFSCLR